MRTEKLSHVHTDATPAGGSQWSSRVSAEVGKAVLGQLSVIERLQIALLTGGHVLLEGMPGLAAFGIDPTPLSSVAPEWLGRFEEGGRFQRSQRRSSASVG